MSYATLQDMTDRFGLPEMVALAPRPGHAGQVDEPRVALALRDASAELDSYFATRMATPLADPPDLVVSYTCHLAREALDRNGREALIEAGKRARAWAANVAKGLATLGAAPAGETGEPAAPVDSGIAVSAPDRVFDDAGLRGYMR